MMGRVVVTYRESESRCEDGVAEHDGGMEVGLKWDELHVLIASTAFSMGCTSYLSFVCVPDLRPVLISEHER